MENPILEAKKEIVEWVANLDDSDVIQQLMDLKSNNNSPAQVFESSSMDDDFDQQFAAGMTSEELLENVFTHIESLSKKSGANF